MSRPARVTIIQFEHDADDPGKNLRRLKEHVRAHRDSDLVIFPELALHGHEPTHDPAHQVRRALRAVTEDEITAFHAFIASEGARVIYGELVERDRKLYNLATFTDGRERVSYAKTHVHWSEPFEPGDSFPIVETRIGRLGMMICFDAGFPEVPRILALRGAEMLVNISAIPEHFPIKYVHRRIVGHAIENQVFVIFANRTGEGFSGGSAIVDPRGEILAVADDTETALTLDIDLAEVDLWRREEPLFPNRRPHLYSDIASNYPAGSIGKK